MKLRNKKTGETINGGFVVCEYKDGARFSVKDKPVFDSLAELNEDWEDAPDEEWRDVLGFEELYQVSNLGNVRTVKRGEATVMAQEEQRNGYLSVHLRNRGIERRASVHRLVAEAFIPNPDGLRDVNHKNGIKTDNRLENLEWMSHSDNMKHQYQVLKTGRYGHLYEPKEPLIKDPKARKLFRKWADLFGTEQFRVNHFSDSRRKTTSIGSADIVTEPIIELPGHIGEDSEIYTKEELCGEE